MPVLRQASSFVGYHSYTAIMQVYKSESTLYIKQELKSWAVWAAILLTIFLVNYFFSMVSQSTLLYGAGFFIFLKAIDTLKEYHIKEILIDQDANEFITLLKSKLSGNKMMNYNLDSVSTELSINRNSFTLFKPTTLFIYLPEKRYYRITNRYGFPTKTLIEIHDVLNNKSITSGN